MEVFLIGFVVVVVALLGMSVGVLMGREPIKGSCGGLSSIEGAECQICGARSGDECKEEPTRRARASERGEVRRREVGT